MDNTDKAAEEMMSLVMDVIHYTHENGLDITNKEDVRKAVEAVRPEQKDSVDLDVLIQGLVAFEKMAKDEAANRKEPESN